MVKGVVLDLLGRLYCHGSRWRRRYYHKRQRGAIPSVVIGNISVGGSGKTPLTLFVAKQLRDFGFRPVIISRGYRARRKDYPALVTKSDDPTHSGDEPVWFARHTDMPVVIGPKRLEDLAFARTFANIAVLDDGFQHMPLLPNLSLVVCNFGNSKCLPAGPLREPLSALHAADALLSVDAVPCPEMGKPVFSFATQVDGLKSLKGDEHLPSSYLQGKAVHAVAGIARPERFFQTLRALGVAVTPWPFPDHHPFSPHDFAAMKDKIIVMTEKDGVKCQHFQLPNAYVLRIAMAPDSDFVPWLRKETEPYLS